MRLRKMFARIFMGFVTAMFAVIEVSGSMISFSLEQDFVSCLLLWAIGTLIILILWGLAMVFFMMFFDDIEEENEY